MPSLPAVRPTLVDRLVTAIAPNYGVRRWRARLAMAMTGQFSGAKSKKSALKAWQTIIGSADSDSLGDLEELRARSRDLDRNNPIAHGAKNTSRSHTVGTGLRFRSQIDRELLGLTEAQAEVWERRFEKLFHLWAKSKACDITLKQNFYELQGLVFNSVFESGDVFVTRRRPKTRAVAPLALGLIEADRVDTPDVLQAEDADIRSGVRLDADGAAMSYFVFNDHPGDGFGTVGLDFVEIPAYGANSGERMVLHVFQRLRPGQTRGIPELAPVIEILKQLDRYTEAELMAAVVASFFTVFVKTNDGSGLAPGDKIAGLDLKSDEVALGPGSVMSLNDGESIETANPGRSNSNFDAFFSAILRQIGVALGIPYELLVMHFAASYSASRAALEMAGKFFAERREWLATDFCDPVVEWFASDALDAGLIEAPGFFGDPVKRAAWLAGMWIPPVGLVLDPEKEWRADELGIEVGAQTLEEVTLKRTGGDWRQKTEQRIREHEMRAGGKLEPEILGQTGAAPPPSDGGAPDESHPKGSRDARD